jgi:hypothetical protein
MPEGDHQIDPEALKMRRQRYPRRRSTLLRPLIALAFASSTALVHPRIEGWKGNLENIHRARAGQDLINLVDFAAGY